MKTEDIERRREMHRMQLLARNNNLFGPDDDSRDEDNVPGKRDEDSDTWERAEGRDHDVMVNTKSKPRPSSASSASTFSPIF